MDSKNIIQNNKFEINSGIILKEFYKRNMNEKLIQKKPIYMDILQGNSYYNEVNNKECNLNYILKEHNTIKIHEEIKKNKKQNEIYYSNRISYIYKDIKYIGSKIHNKNTSLLQPKFVGNHSYYVSTYNVTKKLYSNIEEYNKCDNFSNLYIHNNDNVNKEIIKKGEKLENKHNKILYYRNSKTHNNKRNFLLKHEIFYTDKELFNTDETSFKKLVNDKSTMKYSEYKNNLILGKNEMQKGSYFSGNFNNSNRMKKDIFIIKNKNSHETLKSDQKYASYNFKSNNYWEQKKKILPNIFTNDYHYENLDNCLAENTLLNKINNFSLYKSKKNYYLNSIDFPKVNENNSYNFNDQNKTKNNLYNYENNSIQLYTNKNNNSMITCDQKCQVENTEEKKSGFTRYSLYKESYYLNNELNNKNNRISKENVEKEITYLNNDSTKKCKLKKQQFDLEYNNSFVIKSKNFQNENQVGNIDKGRDENEIKNIDKGGNEINNIDKGGNEIKNVDKDKNENKCINRNKGINENEIKNRNKGINGNEIKNIDLDKDENENKYINRDESINKSEIKNIDKDENENECINENKGINENEIKNRNKGINENEIKNIDKGRDENENECINRNKGINEIKNIDKDENECINRNKVINEIKNIDKDENENECINENKGINEIKTIDKDENENECINENKGINEIKTIDKDENENKCINIDKGINENEVKNEGKYQHEYFQNDICKKENEKLKDQLKYKGVSIFFNGDRRFFLFDIPPNEIIERKNIQIIELISEGSFGIVYKAIWNNKIVAVKKAHENMSLEGMRSIVREMNTYRSVSHDYIIEYYGVCIEESFIGIVIEYLNKGNVFDILYNNTVDLSYEIRLNMATQLVCVINYLHENEKIVHRDLKTSNLLLDENYNLKLCDFGKTRKLDKDGKIVLEDNGGSPRYMAPECFIDKNIITEKADIWGLACCLIEIFGGLIPFQHIKQKEDVIIEILLNKKKPEIPNWFHPDLLSLLERSFSTDPNRRPSCNEYLKLLLKFSSKKIKRSQDIV
ncbi:protein kinase, putative [Plasmodium gallinaceum]|uniref:Protein kinase, putative n=1 Tax=Plasmodium gallinaceum TaxID=5849 RepID=A0A1J1GPX5_PLAGA|nr:protein kinase, putative [Plasmodium gallinaceum]CRG93074.1 protein kinase, putative [Plasmodium gallinaceum]